MSTNAQKSGPRLLPVMQYRDIGRATEWLVKAFGFQEHHTVRGTDGKVLYAVVSFEDSLIMIGPVRGAEFGGLMKQPDEIGGCETQTCYLIVDDAAAHCARAKAAGGDIVFDLADYDHGGRGYSCRDPEGHIWTFGTYDPRSPAATAPAASPLFNLSRPLLAACLALAVVAAGSGWLVAKTVGGPAISVAELQSERTARERAEHLVQEASLASERDRAAKETAERETQLVKSDLERETQAAKLESVRQSELAKNASDRQAKLAEVELQKQQDARDALGKQLAAAESASAASERSVQQVKAELDRQRGAVETLKKDLSAAVAAKGAADSRAQQIQVELRQQRGSADALNKQLLAAKASKDDTARQLQQAKTDLDRGRDQAASLQKQLAAASEAKEASGRELAGIKQQLQRERAKVASLETKLREEGSAKDEAKRAAEAAQQRLTELQSKDGAAATADEPTASSGTSSPEPKDEPKRSSSSPGGRSSGGARSGANAAPMPALVP